MDRTKPARLARKSRGRAAGRSVALGLALAASASCAARQFSDADATAIETVLVAQRDAWNAGDIDAFMQAYVQGPELIFTSGAQVRRGYDEALARYKAKYVDHGAMGRLSFTDLEVTSVGADAAVVLGRWKVDQSEQAGEGIFSLVLVRRAGAWKIVHDHTSALPAPP